MILTTITPHHEVLDGFRSEKRNQLTVQFGNKWVVVEPVSGQHAQVVRLISSDAADYLDPRWQPGALVPLHLDGSR